MAAKLTLDDIVDLRAYEREREGFRDRIIALKRKRRISVGPLVTVVFEHTGTVRFQVQEMARAERMLTDAATEAELDVDNPLVPGAGQLSATPSIELREEAERREMAPKLVGIERSGVLQFGYGTEVRPEPDADHAARLTRADTTPSVHYLRWSLSGAQAAAFAAGPVVLRLDHPEYGYDVPLSDDTRIELAEDLR